MSALDMTSELRGVGINHGTDSSLPAKMFPVEPPPGTKYYSVSAERVSSSFGLKNMAHGLIRTFRETPGAASDYAPGTFLMFMPGELYVHVVRRGLTAEELNSIGQLCGQLEKEKHLRRYLPTALNNAGGLMNNLKTVGVSLLENAEGGYVESDIEMWVEEIGEIVKKMTQSLQFRDKNIKKTAEELDALGVTLVQSHTGSMGDGFLPSRYITRT